MADSAVSSLHHASKGKAAQNAVQPCAILRTLWRRGIAPETCQSLSSLKHTTFLRNSPLLGIEYRALVACEEREECHLACHPPPHQRSPTLLLPKMYLLLIQNLLLEYPLFAWHSIWFWTWATNRHQPSRCLAWMPPCFVWSCTEMSQSVEVPEFTLTFDKECGC